MAKKKKVSKKAGRKKAKKYGLSPPRSPDTFSSFLSSDMSPKDVYIDDNRYINDSSYELVAETYIHIKLPARNQEEFILNSKRALKKYARQSARRNFKKDVYIEISLEDGSIIAKIKVGIKGLIIFTIAYGGVRTGIDYYVKDARAFSEYVIENYEDEVNIQEKDVIRLERRLGLPGKIKRYFKEMDKLDSDDLNDNQKRELLSKLKKDLVVILKSIDSQQERQILVNSLPNEVVAMYQNDFEAVQDVNRDRQRPTRYEIYHQPFIRDEDRESLHVHIG